MRSKIILILIAFFGLSAVSAFADILPVESKKEWKAQVFLANQIKGVGLVDSYQEDWQDISYIYDDALAVMANMAMKNVGMAKEILDTISKEIKTTSDGMPFESYHYYDTTGNGTGSSYCGNVAWLLQSFNIYQRTTGNREYYSCQKKMADFLLKLQDPKDGGLRGSICDTWKSTENNLAAYVALRNFGRINGSGYYMQKAEKVRIFLKSRAVWDGQRFNRGPGDPTEVTDVQALGVLVLGNNYRSALDWAEVNLQTIKPFNGKVITGFDFNDDLDTLWSEGTLQMALAFSKANNPLKGDYYYNEISQAIGLDGSLVLATNRGSASEYWTLEPWRAAAPTCWLIFYSTKFNPLVLY